MQLAEQFLHYFVSNAPQYVNEDKYPSDSYLKIIRMMAIAEYQATETNTGISEEEYVIAAFDAYSKFILGYC